MLLRFCWRAASRASVPAGRRSIMLKSKGPWTCDDDLSLTHARCIDATFNGHLPIPNTREKDSPLTPGMFLLYFNQPYPESRLSPDGYDDSQSPEGSYTNRRWYGGSVSFNLDSKLLLGSPSRCVEQVQDIRKSGRGDRVTVTIERTMSDLADKSGNWAVREERSMFYFDADPAVIRRQLGRTISSEYEPKFEHTIKPSQLTLFRYSALSFNSHLIHYNPIYSRETEQLPNILVQGPFMVTSMLWWMSSVVLKSSPRQIKKFKYRNIAPIFVDDTMRLCATHILQDSYEVWIENSKKSVVLSGTITVA